MTTQRLTLEEMLALARKVTFWKRIRDYNGTYQVRQGWYKSINLVISGWPGGYGINYKIEAHYNGTRIGGVTCTEHWAVDGASGKAIPPEKETFSTVFSAGSIPRKVVPPDNEGIITLFNETYCHGKYLYDEDWEQEEEQYFQEAKRLAREAMGK